MTKGSPPLRFLALVVGGWIVARTAFLGSQWLELPVERTAPRATAKLLTARLLPSSTAMTTQLPAQARELPLPASHVSFVRPHPAPQEKMETTPMRFVSSAPQASPLLPAQNRPLETMAPALTAAAGSSATAVPSGGSRWSGSAWLFARRGDSQPLAPAAGTLGGSQFGARILYRLDADRQAPISLSGRVYSPLGHFNQAEIAAGLDWQPIAHVPVHILGERRQAIGNEGRSAFSLLAYGGVSDAHVVGPIRLDAYAQGGIVGARSRDLFADGSVRLSAPLVSRVAVGAGLWGAAQPGVARLDAGPFVSLPIVRRIRLSADLRFRIAGHARPASGPALTLAADF